MSIWSGFAGALTGAVGSIFGSSQASKNTKATIAAQKQAQEYEWQQNLALYHYNNQYNSPEQQMSRLQEAGLNPNLVYGTGAVGNSSGQPPQFEAPRPDYSGQRSTSGDFLQALSTYLDYQQKQAQIDNLQETNKMLQEQTAGVEIENARKEFDLGFVKDTRESDYMTRFFTGRRSAEEYNTSIYNSEIKRVESQVVNETYPEAVMLVKQELRNAEKRGQNLDQDYLLKVQNTLAQRLENDYRKLGITNSDALAYRVIARVLSSLFPNFSF